MAGRSAARIARIAALIGMGTLQLAWGQAPSEATAGPLCAAGASIASALPLRTTELIVVKADALSATTGRLSLWRRSGGCFAEAGGPWSASVGRAGLSSNRREGDGTTPLGTFSIGPVIFGIEPDPGTRFRYHRLVCGDWWDEDPASASYNHFVHVPCGLRPPFGGDSEALWTELPVYRYFAVIDFNTDPVVRGRGSGIFLHVASGSPTNGCIALAEAELVHVLRWLRPSNYPLITISA